MYLIDIVVVNDIVEVCVQVIQHVHYLQQRKQVRSVYSSQLKDTDTEIKVSVRWQ